ncbi:MAG: PilC/PilY family type IV pilus protein [Acidobacteria bacterium]|nr:PilC/PilY family type IV pilus protein [Acidobacteriota bacterium]
MTNATDIHGTALPNTSSGSFSQASNVVLTSGFSLPGFNARLRAFRTYKPVADATQPYGYKFSGDGTPLWLAHAPAADQRNIYTYLPSTGQQIAFTQANIATLKPYLGLSGLTDAEATAWAADIIDYVRQQPLGPIVLSTPALVGPPSMSPVPDADYPAFASARKQRRATVYYGGDDGMIHAIDGRLGVETWAFIPFNLLPQLQTLIDGQPIDSFEYFVSGAPKVADVKVNGAWRTYMMIGEALGGTFYQTFDISNANLGVATSSDSESAVLASFSSPDVIPFKWSFPSMLSFDPTMVATYMPYGDLKASASAIEKTVGQATSTPAIAQVGDATSPWVALVGSGYLSPLVQAQANRNKVNGGTTFYVLDMATGSVLSSYNVGDDANKESLKAALEADPSSMGTNNSWFIDRVYIGDTEGTLWRFRITKSGSAISLSTPVKMYDAAEWNPIYTSVALLNNGPEQNYIFLSTGIDILPWTRMKKVQQFAIIGLLDSGGTGTAQKLFEQKLDKSDSSGGDERPTSNPTVAGGVVFFTTTTEYPDTPCRTVESSLWAMTPAGGVAYDLNRDGHTTTADTQLQRATGRATGVYVADNHLYFGTDQGLHVFGEPDGFNNSIVHSTCRTLAWRERR